jgi:glycerol-3-phosphate acyltransferase PlsY
MLDAGKGGIAVLIARALFGEDAAQAAGSRRLHRPLFPVFLGFKGGKGVATFLGTLLALWWPAGVAACLTWLLVAAVSRYSSLSALGGGRSVAALGRVPGSPRGGASLRASRGPYPIGATARTSRG